MLFGDYCDAQNFIKNEPEFDVFESVVIKTEHFEYEGSESNTKSFNEEELKAPVKPQPSSSKHLKRNSCPKIRKYYCDYCGQDYKEKCSIDRHVLKHIPLLFREKTFKCSFCPNSYYSEMAMRFHERQKHQSIIGHRKKQNFKCDYCRKRFYDKMKLQSHISIHFNNGKPYKCSFCPLAYFSKRACKYHERWKHPEGRNNDESEDFNSELEEMVDQSLDRPTKKNYQKTTRFACDDCGKGFYDKRHFQRHVLSHTPLVLREKSFLCSFCPNSYHSEDALKFHENQKHDAENDSQLRESEDFVTNPMRYSCDYCGMNYKEKRYIENHVLTHTSKIPSRLFQSGPQTCDKCGKVLASRGTLRSHMKIFHDEKSVENAMCNICGKIYKFMYQLRQHLRSHEKPFKCDEPGCDKVYSKRFELKEHKNNQHLGIKRFFCPFENCGKGFYTRQKLLKHTKIIHEKYRKNCPVFGCKFMVGVASYMRAHLKKHTELDKDQLQAMLDNIKNMKLVH